MKKVKIEHYSDKEALDFHTNEKSGKIRNKFIEADDY